jgi:phosphoribosylaminoimidazole carboxylase (NCAIR synthetase)
VVLFPAHCVPPLTIAWPQEKVDILTTEIEHINVDAVEAAAAATGLEMEPTAHTIRIIQVTLLHACTLTHTTR